MKARAARAAVALAVLWNSSLLRAEGLYPGSVVPPMVKGVSLMAPGHIAFGLRGPGRQPWSSEQAMERFKSREARRPTREELIGVWEKVAKVSVGSEGVYDPEGLMISSVPPEHGYRIFLDEANPFVQNGRALSVYDASGGVQADGRDQLAARENWHRANVDFNDRSVGIMFTYRSRTVVDSQCRIVDSDHLLCELSQHRKIKRVPESFEGFARVQGDALPRLGNP